MKISAPLCLAACLLAAGCAALPAFNTAPNPDQVQAQIARDEAAVRTLRGSARVDATGGAESGSAHQVIAIALPDRARLETLTPIGTTALMIVIRGDELRVHSPVRKEFGIGPATAETLGRLVRVPMPPAFLLRLLAGLPPFPVRPEDPRTGIAVEGAAVRLDAVEGIWWERLWTGAGDPAIVRGELGQASGVLLRFGYDDRRAAGETVFPFGIWAEEAATGTRLTLTYERVRLNLPVDDSLFELPLPSDGSRVIRLDGGPASEGLAPASRP